MTKDEGDDDPLRRELRPAGPVKLTLSETQHGDTTIVGVRGEFDILTAPKVGTLLDEVLRNRTGDVVVDLRDTNFIDSGGLAVLLNASRRLARGSRGLRVVCKPGPVRQVFEISRLIETLGVVSSLDEVD